MLLAKVFTLLLLTVVKGTEAADKTFNSVGCLLSNAENSVLRHRALQDNAMTQEMCRDTCFLKASTYFGLHGGDMCYCGNALHEPHRLEARKCLWKCPGNRTQQCGGDMGAATFKFASPGPTGNKLYRPSLTVLFFSIRAHTGNLAVQEYFTRSGNQEIKIAEIPGDRYRSGLLDNLPQAIGSNKLQFIVAEMRKGADVVAQAVFDVTDSTDKIDLISWFSAQRLVSSYPFLIDKGGNFKFFSITGQNHVWTTTRHHYWRSFYIQQQRMLTDCSGDQGFWGIAERREQAKECDWITKDTANGYPSLFYSRQQGVPFRDTVDYADQFVIYGAAN